MVKHTITIRAQKNFLSALLYTVQKDLEQVGCPADKLEEICICVEEIFVNIASYAYPETEGTVEIAVETQEGKSRIMFMDNGMPYNPLKQETPDILCSAQERAIGGLGIYMVKNLTDRLDYTYQNGQNCLLMEYVWQA